MIGRRVTVASLAALMTIATVSPTSAVSPTSTRSTQSASCVRAEGVTGRHEYTGALSDWLTCLYPVGSAEARGQRLNAIMMPGSHAAGTDAFYNAEATTFGYARECGSTVDRAAQGLSWVTRQWAMAQTRPTGQQADLGSRWFELKGVFDNYVWRSCDGLVGDRWFDVINDLVAFESAHPGEVVILDLAHLLDPITEVSASRLVEALAPACRRAVTPWTVTGARSAPGDVTVEQARRAGGFVILVSDSRQSHEAYQRLQTWLAQHPTSACAGRLWSRRGTVVHVDHAPGVQLWRQRNDTTAASARLVRWQDAHLVDAHGAFQVNQFTWDVAGPARGMPYQIWLMNHWLVDFNERLARPTRDLAQALWMTKCATGIPANVVLLDNISHERPLRELIGYNLAHCPPR